MCWCNPKLRTPCCGGVDCKPRFQSLMEWQPKEHFEIDPVTQVSCTRKPTYDEVRLILEHEIEVSVQVINFFRWLDKLPPLGRGMTMTVDFSENELLRIEDWFVNRKYWTRVERKLKWKNKLNPYH